MQSIAIDQPSHRAARGRGPLACALIGFALACAVTQLHAGSLHEAILNANANTGVTDTITFNIPGAGPHVINLTAALPAKRRPIRCKVGIMMRSRNSVAIMASFP